MAVPFDFVPVILTGRDAKNYVAERHEGSQHWLSDATDCYVYDDGTWGGHVWYWSSTHESNAACFSAMQASRFPSSDMPRTQDDMQPWEHSEWQVVMNGPAQYRPDIDTSLWDVKSISNGVYYQHAIGTSSLFFWAIDLDSHRLYHHYESGGFREAKYIAPTDGANRQITK
ncbi:MAG: hypothetical protein ABJZ55_07110 [Fuerstiella sp.]